MILLIMLSKWWAGGLAVFSAFYFYPDMMHYLLVWIFSRFFHVEEITRQRKLELIRSFIAKHAMMSGTSCDKTNALMPGIHISWSNWMIYIQTEAFGMMKPSRHFLISLLGAKRLKQIPDYYTQEIPIFYSYGTKYLRHEITPRPWQKDLLDQIIPLYLKARRLSLILCGAPGTGKTMMAQVIAQELKKYDLLADIYPSVTVRSSIWSGKPTSPNIYSWNECDSELEGQLDEKGAPINKMSVNNFLDAAGDILEHTIFLATTNTNIVKFRPSLIRKGRFDYVCVVKSNTDFEIVPATSNGVYPDRIKNFKALEDVPTAPLPDTYT